MPKVSDIISVYGISPDLEKRLESVTHQRYDKSERSMGDPEEIYAVNREYDDIRGILRSDPELWEKCRGIYWARRFQQCNATLARIDSTDQDEYREQMTRELSWGYARREFTQKDFAEDDWTSVRNYLKRGHSSQEASVEATQARAELEMVMNSTSYKVGRAITWLPRRIRSAIKPR